jgi:hypothetical protein
VCSRCLRWRSVFPSIQGSGSSPELSPSSLARRSRRGCVEISPYARPTPPPSSSRSAAGSSAPSSVTVASLATF